MAASLKTFLNRFTHSQATTDSTGFNKAPTATQLFPKTDPVVDGEECLHDCASCSIKYPAKFSIDEHERLYGHVKGWSTHILVATGKTDWVRDVADEKGSIMEAIDRCKIKPSNGPLKLSASNMPLPDSHFHELPSGSSEVSTTVLLLPSFTLVDNVTPSSVPDLIANHIDKGPTNTTPLTSSREILADSTVTSTMTEPQPQSNGTADLAAATANLSLDRAVSSDVSNLIARPCPHKYLILLCSQKTRDARCGQSAPLLRKEFERHLRPLGLYRDLHDERPGGVGIYFISHVGGHKFSANVIIYRRADALESGKAEAMNGTTEGESNGKIKEDAETAPEAAQCIWLARVRPEDCENIIRYTVLQGKVVKPESQLRGGFDRCKQLKSW